MLSSMKMHRYTLQLVDQKGIKRNILEDEIVIEKIRSVAFGIRLKGGRKIVILRDGKELPGGRHALDDEAYRHWLILAEGRRVHDATCGCCRLPMTLVQCIERKCGIER